MVKRSKLAIVVLMLGIMSAAAIFFEARPLGSSDQIGQEVKDGFSYRCRIFVKGHYAYVLRRTPVPKEDGYLWVFDVDSIKWGKWDTCANFLIPKARDVFVSGEYLYVARRVVAGGWGVRLRKYSVSDGCGPDSVDEGSAWGAGIAFTDMCITNNRAYLSHDCGDVVVFDVSGDSVKHLPDEQIHWSTRPGSLQGLHVRGRYAYLATESEGLWIYDLDSHNLYQAKDHSAGSRDAYNVVCAENGTGKSRTYEGTDNSLVVWDTDNLNNIESVGSFTTSGHIVHITGNWVYWLKPKFGPLYACSLVCGGNFSPLASYGPPDDKLHDFHVVHDSTGHAHLYGAYPDATDTGVVLWYGKADNHTINYYLYGDVNGDLRVDSTDVAALISYVEKGQKIIVNLDASDVNCDGEVNTDDSKYLYNYLFKGGPKPGADCSFYY